jgi:hypothetical protein
VGGSGKSEWVQRVCKVVNRRSGSTRSQRLGLVGMEIASWYTCPERTHVEAAVHSLALVKK